MEEDICTKALERDGMELKCESVTSRSTSCGLGWSSPLCLLLQISVISAMNEECAVAIKPCK